MGGHAPHAKVPKDVKIRRLTVSALYREWGQPHHKNGCVVPSIRLNGKWLAGLGIVVGQRIRVVTNGTTITIEPLGFDREAQVTELKS